MTIWQVFVTVFAGLGGSAVLLAAIAWLLKSALAAWIAKDAETFKVSLKADADFQIERLKNSLQMAAIEHQVRFSKLHERRAGFIEDLYKKLTLLNLHGEQFVLRSENNPTPHQAEEFTEMQEELREVFVFAEQHRIYLPESVCALVDKHLGQLRNTIWTAGIFGRLVNANDRTVQQSNEAFTKAYKEFETDIPAARKSLEAEFRKMLGAERAGNFALTSQ
jgi:hypothetical protein